MDPTYRTHHARRQSIQQQKCLKLVLLGSVKVGKSTLIRLCQRKNFNSTYKPSTEKSVTATIPIGTSPNDNYYHCEVKDIQGLARNESVDDRMVMRQNGIILVYSIDDRETFDLAANTLGDLADRIDFEDVVIMLVANKSDLDSKREVSYDQGLELADEHNIKFYELSAKEIGEKNLSNNNRSGAERCPVPFIDMVRTVIEAKDRSDPSMGDSNQYLVVGKGQHMKGNNSSGTLNTPTEQMIAENPSSQNSDNNNNNPLPQNLLDPQQTQTLMPNNRSPNLPQRHFNQSNFLPDQLDQNPEAHQYINNNTNINNQEQINVQNQNQVQESINRLSPIHQGNNFGNMNAFGDFQSGGSNFGNNGLGFF